MFCWRKIQKQQLKKVPFGMTDETTHIPLSLWACTSPIAVELLTFSCIGSQRQWHRYCASFMDVESFLDRLNACPQIRFEREDLTEETPRGEAFWSKTKCEEKKELIMKRGLHRAHYNYENWLAFKKKWIHMTAQIQGKHVSLSITGACRTQTELRKCNMGVWQTQGTSTWSSVISLTCYSTLRRAVVQGLTHKMHFSNKLCWCSSLLFSPSDVFFFWQIHTLKGGIRYRRHQVMTPTPNYPRWLVSCLSVTSQVLPDQTLLYGSIQ